MSQVKDHSERVVVIHSPSSTRAEYYKNVVQPQIKNLPNVIDIAVNNTPLDQTIISIAKRLRPNDIVIAAGGDGTSNAVLNACMKAGSTQRFAVLPLGRGNDAAFTLTGRSLNIARILSAPHFDFHPMEIIVNGKHRYLALQHIALGWAAAASQVMDQNSRRRNVTKTSIAGAVPDLYQWYQDVVSNPDATMPTPFHGERGEEIFRNGYVCCLGRVARVFWPRQKGTTLGRRSLHRDAEKLFVFGGRLRGDPSELLLLSSATTIGVESEVTPQQIIRYNKPTAGILCAVDGELIDLGKVREIIVRRSQKSIPVLAPRLVKTARPSVSRPNQRAPGSRRSASPDKSM